MKLTKTRTITRLLATALSLLLVISAVPMLVGADGETGTDGKLLLQMSALDADSVTYNPNGITLTNVSNFDADKKAGRGSDGAITATTANNYGGIGLNTNLPLTTSSQYTIIFYAKPEEVSRNLGFYFGFGQESKTSPLVGTNFLFYSNAMRTFSQWQVNGWKGTNGGNHYGLGAGSGVSNIWNRVSDNGLVRFVLTLDQGKMTVSIGGNPIPKTFDMESSVDTGNNKFPNLSMLGGNLCLRAGYSAAKAGSDNFGDWVSPAVGDSVMRLKDISIYSGVGDSYEEKSPIGLTFHHLDGTTESVLRTATTTLPTTEGDKAVVWTGEDGALVTDLSALTRDTVLTAHDAGIPAVLGYQTGKKTETSYALRVIGGIYSDEGSKIGFKLTLKYKDGDTVKTGTKDLSGDTVYTSIAETEDKTVTAKTAQQLGAMYLFALAIEEIPLTAGQVDITVTPYWVIGDNTVEGEARSISLVNGEPAADAVPLQ